MVAARKIYSTLLAISILTTAASLFLIWRQPYTGILVNRETLAIEAMIESQLARYVTTEMLLERMHVRLSEEKRNWLVIDALKNMAMERGITLSAELQAEYDNAFNEDHAAWKNVEDCAACLWDVQNCNLSPALVCHGVSAVTPLGDVAGIMRESSNYISGEPVDNVELILSTAGLAAFAAAPFVAGTSWPIKTGASLAKVAYQMRLLSPRLVRFVRKSAFDYDHGVNMSWFFTDIPDFVRIKLTRASTRMPIEELLGSFGKLKNSVGLLASLHLARYIDTPGEARKLARIAEVEKDRTVGVVELLGKNRTLKVAMRYSNEAWALFSGLFGLLLTILSLIFKSIITISMRVLRRSARPGKEVVKN